jgi:hypothetical protein
MSNNNSIEAFYSLDNPLEAAVRIELLRRRITKRLAWRFAGIHREI